MARWRYRSRMSRSGKSSMILAAKQSVLGAQVAGVVVAQLIPQVPAPLVNEICKFGRSLSLDTVNEAVAKVCLSQLQGDLDSTPLQAGLDNRKNKHVNFVRRECANPLMESSPRECPWL